MCNNKACDASATKRRVQCKFGDWIKRAGCLIHNQYCWSAGKCAGDIQSLRFASRKIRSAFGNDLIESATTDDQIQKLRIFERLNDPRIRNICIPQRKILANCSFEKCSPLKNSGDTCSSHMPWNISKRMTVNQNLAFPRIDQPRSETRNS